MAELDERQPTSSEGLPNAATAVDESDPDQQE
jgi:hypothetical protein